MLIKRSYVHHIESEGLVGSVWSDTTSTNTAELKVVRDTTKSSVKTVGYRALVVSGKALPNNVFSFHRNDMEYAVWKVDKVTRTSRMRSRFYYGGTTSSTFSADSPQMVALRVRASNACIANAKGHQWNVPVFLAEGKKTAQMVYDAARRLTTLALALKSGNISGFIYGLACPRPSPRAMVGIKRRFKRSFDLDPAATAGRYWLEYSYGWVPFIKDVYDAGMTLQELASTERARLGTARGYARMRSTEKTTYTNACPMPVQWGMTNPLADWITSFESEWSVRVTWKFMVTDPTASQSLGLLNPLVVAWELVPFSFVADWFIPIGNYLENLDVNNRFTSYGGCYGYRRFSSKPAITVTKVRTAGATMDAKAQPCQSVTVLRRPFTGSPSPEFGALFHLPEYFKGSRAKVATSVALLHQIVSGFRR